MPNRPDLYARWALEMRRAKLFGPGERIGVAVSGGPDSVLLLEFMKQFAGEVGLALAVVHFNHRLRGAEAHVDERFVRELSRKHKIEFLRGDADVARVASVRHRNLEATARDLRYQFFFSIINRRRVDKVATAHTLNDQAETVLLKLLRGAGTRGLGGIYPTLEGMIVRPFLSLTRAEIEAELRRRKLEWRVDPTNKDLDLRRNKIRRELLPLLQKEYNPEVLALLKGLADRARDDEAYLEQQARARALAWRVREGAEERIQLRALQEFPPAIERRVLRQMVQAVGGSLRGFTYGHIEALRKLVAEAQSGRSLALPGRLVARRQFDWLVIGPESADISRSGFSYRIEVPGEVSVPQLGLIFEFKIVEPNDLGGSYNGVRRVGLNPDSLGQGLVLRAWRPGDRYHPSGGRKVQRLKELFRERKIPLEQRKFWPVLESGNEIVWVRGFPPARHALPSSGAGKVLEVQESQAATR